MVAAVSRKAGIRKERKYGKYELELDIQRRGNFSLPFFQGENELEGECPPIQTTRRICGTHFPAIIHYSSYRYWTELAMLYFRGFFASTFVNYARIFQKHDIREALSGSCRDSGQTERASVRLCKVLVRSAASPPALQKTATWYSASYK
jgi:hypothetical protein